VALDYVFNGNHRPAADILLRDGGLLIVQIR
jgi:hypothetical protein